MAVVLVVGLVVRWASLTVDGMVDNSAVGKVVSLDDQQVGSLAVVLVDSKDASSVAHLAADSVVEKAFLMVESHAACRRT